MSNERKKITMNDIAREACVSQSTVSRVVNHYQGIKESKLRKVVAAMKKLGYEPPSVAEVSRKTVCLVICPLPEQRDILGMDFNIQVQEGVQTVLNANGVNFMLLIQSCNADSLNLPQEKIQSISGFIFLGAVENQRILDELESQNIPYVIAQGGMPSSAGERCDRIAPDEFETAHLICDYLESQGRRRIGFILSRTFAHRLDGFRLEAMKRKNLRILEEDIVLLDTTDKEDHIKAAYLYASRKDLPDALITSHHGGAVQIRSIFNFNGIRVPEDILIVSYAHTESQNQLPCVLHRAYLLGYKAARRILEKFADPDDVPCKIFIPSELINIT